MPSPAVIKPNGEIFQLTEVNNNEEAIFSTDNYLFTLYATNRQPLDSVNKSGTYSIFPSETLRLGFTVHRVGNRDMSWEEMIEQSVRTDRDNKLLLENVYRREAVAFDLSADLEVLPDQADGVFERINSILAKSFDKDILLYIHGANSNFYRATAQAAQFYHFTGHNSLVMTFSWPSAENLLKYKTDVLHAKKTIPAFARLVQLLSKYTKARNINILAYSAGAQVVAPGLVYLRDQYLSLSASEIRQKLRIGEIYFAAPDTAFKPFIERYRKFKDIVGRTTINLNENDSVLRMSAFQNGVSRLGKPNRSEISNEETQVVIDWLKSPYLNVIDVGKSEPLNIGNAHDSWYSHPWVSADVLMLLLFNLDPGERGLEEHWVDGIAKTYRFPADYDVKIQKLIDDNREILVERASIEHGN